MWNHNYLTTGAIFFLGIFSFVKSCDINGVDPALYESTTGVYKGILPCEDCEAIVYELALQPDSTYLEKRMYKGKSKESESREGRYLITTDSVVSLQKEETGFQYFAIQPGGLQLLNQERQPFTTGTAGPYLLDRVDTDQTLLTRNLPPITRWQMENGIDFHATGKNPNWEVEMNYEGNMIFRASNGSALEVPSVPAEPIESEDGSAVLGVLHASANDEGAAIRLNIKEQPCQLSSNPYPRQVVAEIKMSPEEEYTRFRGCGRYIADYRLHDIWVLESINGQAIDSTQYEREVPRLEINLQQSTIFGYTGCNSFSGSIAALPDGAIRFSRLAVTEMACQNMELEGLLLNLMGNVQLDYTIGKNQLTLTASEDNKLVFRKVD